MTRGRIIAIVIVVALAVTAIWLIVRKRGSSTATVGAGGSGLVDRSTVTAGDAAGGVATGGDGDDDPGESRYRVIDADARMALMERIRAAREARKAGKPVPPPAAGGDTPPALPGEITPQTVMDGLMPIMPLFKYCYEQGLDRRTIKSGMVEFKIHLVGDPDIGTLVETAELGGEPAFLADAELSQCLQETMMSLELPPMHDDTAIDFTTKMQFSDDGGPEDGSGDKPDDKPSRGSGGQRRGAP